MRFFDWDPCSYKILNCEIKIIYSCKLQCTEKIPVPNLPSEKNPVDVKEHKAVGLYFKYLEAFTLN